MKTKKQPSSRALKRKAKKAEARTLREAEMAAYLRNHGWRQSGPLGDVWKHDSWKPMQVNPQTRHGYVMEEPGKIKQVWSTEPSQKPWKNAEVCMTLYRAYENQLRLDASGYEAPKTLDDDLADLL